MGIRDKMGDLQNNLRTNQKDIKSLQDKCDHKETRIGFEPTDERNISIRIICKDCQKTIGYPTIDQQNKFLEQ
jgi:hypothetical protein